MTRGTTGDEAAASDGRLARTWVAFVIAAVCTAYELLPGVVLAVFQIGYLVLLPIIPAYLVAIPLLVSVGRQAPPRLRRAAIVTGVVLACSMPIAVVTTLLLEPIR